MFRQIKVWTFFSLDGQYLLTLSVLKFWHDFPKIPVLECFSIEGVKKLKKLSSEEVNEEWVPETREICPYMTTVNRE